MGGGGGEIFHVPGIENLDRQGRQIIGNYETKKKGFLSKVSLTFPRNGKSKYRDVDVTSSSQGLAPTFPSTKRKRKEKV